MNKLIKFCTVVGTQVIIILIIILFKVAVLSGGTPVMLKVQPVDPRDLLRGDYMVLRYERVSQIDKSYFAYNNVKVGDTVYVPLANYRGEKYSYAQYGISKVLPTGKGSYYRETVFIKGRVSADMGNSYNVLYNIEEYFIPEGVGQNPGWSATRNDVGVEVLVGDNGDAVLKQLYVDGEVWP